MFEIIPILVVSPGFLSVLLLYIPPLNIDCKNKYDSCTDVCA